VSTFEFWRRKAEEHARQSATAQKPERKARHLLAAADYLALAQLADAAKRRPLPHWARLPRRPGETH
jgi:hypothetical protein